MISLIERQNSAYFNVKFNAKTPNYNEVLDTGKYLFTSTFIGTK